jgi:hypothetical protein
VAEEGRGWRRRRHFWGVRGFRVRERSRPSEMGKKATVDVLGWLGWAGLG